MTVPHHTVRAWANAASSSYGPDAPDDHVCDCGHPWDDHDLGGQSPGCRSLACTCSPANELGGAA